MFKAILKLAMISMMFMVLACNDEGTGGSGGDYDNGTPTITDATITYKDIPEDIATSDAPTITATSHILEVSHFDWSIIQGNDLATINDATSIITVTNPTTTIGGVIEVTATFNNSYTQGTLNIPLKLNVTIKRGSLNSDVSQDEPKWDGTTETPIIPNGNRYEIYKPSELAWVASETIFPNTNYFADKTIKFMKDIDMDNKPFTGIKEFAGLIDGNAKRIFNLNIDKSAELRVGLIGISSGTVIIDNLRISSGNIKGKNYVGSFVGEATGNLTITNSINNAIVEGNVSVGGLIGESDMLLTISNSSNTGTVTGFGDAGGLVGQANNILTIDNSSNTGTVTVTVAGTGSGRGGYVGGLVGLSYDTATLTTISNSLNSGTVVGDHNVGGLIGYTNGPLTIDNSSNTDAVSGTGSVGGLIGSNASGISTTITKITNSSNSGTISVIDYYVGGLVGITKDLTIGNSSNTGAITGNNFVGGLVGQVNGDVILTNIFSYAETITGHSTSTGGLTGDGDDTLTINNSYWLKATDITNASGSNNSATETNVKELTVAKFKVDTNFFDWNFDNTWEFATTDALYPTLRALR